MLIKFTLIPILVSLLFWTPCAAEPLVSFPGKTDRLASPNGRFVVVNENLDQEPNHRLLLKRKGAADLVVLRYGRHVDVEWTSDSGFFFVNDYAESNASDCLVLDASGRRKWNILSILRKDRQTSRDLDGSHLYVTCSSWSAGDRVLVSAIGYNGSVPEGVQKSFSVDFQAGHIATAR